MKLVTPRHKLRRGVYELQEVSDYSTKKAENNLKFAVSMFAAFISISLSCTVLILIY